MQRRSQVQTIVHQYLRLAYADLVIYFSSSKIPSATVHGFRLCCYAAETLLNPPTRLPLPLPPSCPATAGTATLGPPLAAPLFPLSSIKSNKVLDFLQESCGFGIPDLGNRARANTTIDSSLAAIYEGLNDSCCVIEEIVGTAALGCYAADAQEQGQGFFQVAVRASLRVQLSYPFKSLQFFVNGQGFFQRGCVFFFSKGATIPSKACSLFL